MKPRTIRRRGGLTAAVAVLTAAVLALSACSSSKKSDGAIPKLDGSAAPRTRPR